MALLGRIFTLFTFILHTSLNEKKKKSVSEEKHIPMDLLNIAAKIEDLGVDEKVLDELQMLVTDPDTNEFITIYYQRKLLRSILRCAIFDPEPPPEEVAQGVKSWRSKFPKIRKKSWVIFEQLMLAILGIADRDDISKVFTKKAEVLSCARLSSFLNVLRRVYQEINPLLDLQNQDISIDLSKLNYHIEMLEAYADNAKFMIQPSKTPSSGMTASTAMVPGYAATVPGPATVHVPQPNWGVPGPAAVGAVSLVPGPTTADGRQTAPTAVVAPNPYGYGGVPAAAVGYSGVPGPAQHPGYYAQAPQYATQPVGGFGIGGIPFDPPYTTTTYIDNNATIGIAGLQPGGPRIQY